MISLSGRGAALVEMGLCHRISKQCPHTFGYFRPIANRSPKENDTHTRLMRSVSPPHFWSLPASNGEGARNTPETRPLLSPCVKR
eukprot:936062-Prorocentrum_minimum.AAC.1